MITIDETEAVFSKRLRYYRKKKGVTQEELAELITETSEIPVNKATVGAWELGRHLPSVISLLAMSRFLNVSCDVLLGEQPIPEGD